MHIRNTVSILSLFLTVSLSAQTVRWKVAPEYSEMTCISPALLKVGQNGLYGLLGADRKIVAPCRYDAVTPVVEDRCLLLSADGRLQGIFDAGGNQVRMFASNESLHVDPDYPHYSEGYLAVCNSRGNWTYLDKTGKLLPGNPEFRNAGPFLNGYAVVRYKDGSYMHINSRGAISRLDNQFKDNYLVYASSFTPESGQSGNVVAVIVDSGNNVYLRDRSGRKAAALGVVKDWNNTDHILTTDQFVIEFEPNRQIRSIVSRKNGVSRKYSPQILEYYNPSGDNLACELSGGLYRVLQGGKEILPAQFDKQPTFISPTEFIVSRNGCCGILAIDNTCSPNPVLQQSSISYEHHIPMSVRARLGFEPTSDSGNCRIIVKRNGSVIYEGIAGGPEFSFDLLPEELEENDTEVFTVAVDIDGIRHPESVLKLSVSYENRFSVKASGRVKLNSGNTSGDVAVTVTNGSAYGSNLCDIIVDGQTVRRGVRFAGGESITVSVTKAVDIQDLDSVVKALSVQVREEGCPSYRANKSITFERNL